MTMKKVISNSLCQDLAPVTIDIDDLDEPPASSSSSSALQLVDQTQAQTRKKKSMTHVMSLTTRIGCMNILWPKGARLVAMLLFCCPT